MNCYYCEMEREAGGTHYAVRSAVGVCIDCGIAVCSKHARQVAPGEPLRCPEAAHPADTRSPEPVIFFGG